MNFVDRILPHDLANVWAVIEGRDRIIFVIVVNVENILLAAMDNILLSKYKFILSQIIFAVGCQADIT